MDSEIRPPTVPPLRNRLTARAWQALQALLAPLLLAACLPGPLSSADGRPVDVVQAAPEVREFEPELTDQPALHQPAAGPLEEDAGAAPPANAVEPAPGEVPEPADRSDSPAGPPGPLAGPAETPCDPSGSGLPPLGPEVRRSFREPLAPAPLWNPPGPKRVGLQAGHWLVEQAPGELSRLQHGASGGGKQEWEVNLDIAQRTRLLLEAAGVEVDLLPATVPMRYRAHAFISIHADGDPAGRLSGFKIARPGFSSVPAADDQLVAALNQAYGAATRLERDDEHITPRMRYYYAFNSRRYCHAVAPGVPQAIVETGFLTSAADRALLLGDPDAAARGVAGGVLAFLDSLPGD
jgi:N-acetylmuramoyl-L-alanine amidase